MIVIQRDFQSYSENEYFFNFVTRSIIRSFSVIDKGTEYFETNDLMIPYSNRTPITFKAVVDHPGTYTFNTNQRTVYSFYAPISGTYTFKVLLDLGFNEIKALDTLTGELSNAVHLHTKEMYGWIIGAVGQELFRISQDIQELIDFNSILKAEIAALERLFNSIICIKNQPDESFNDFRNLIKYYLIATALQDVYPALRLAGLGIYGIDTIHLSMDHYEDFGNDRYLHDGDGWILDRDDRKFPVIDTVVRGNLNPGIYKYIVTGRLLGDNFNSSAGFIEVDVRYWMVPSTLVLEWPEIGINNDDYQVYKLDQDGFYHSMIRTADNKVFDVGSELDPFDFLNPEDLDEVKLIPRRLDVQSGFNTNVRLANYYTDSPIEIYIHGDVTEYKKMIFGCIYRLVVSAHLQYNFDYIV